MTIIFILTKVKAHNISGEANEKLASVTSQPVGENQSVCPGFYRYRFWYQKKTG